MQRKISYHAILFSAWLFFVHTLSAQNQNLYCGVSDEWLYTIKQTSDNNLLMIGATYSFGAGNSDILVIKTDKDGDTLWTKIFGGLSIEYGYDAVQMNDGGYLLCGQSASWNGGGNYDSYLIRINSSGDTLWTADYGGLDDEGIYAAAELTPGGNIIAAGFTETYGAGNNDIYVLKTDASGNLLWTKTFGGAADDNLHSMIRTSDGGLLLVGSTLSFGAGIYDALVIKMDTSGNLLWTKTFGGAGEDAVYSVVETPGGNFILSGSTTFGAGNYDAWLVAIDASGSLLWNKTYGGAAGYEEGNYIVSAPGGNYIAAGKTGSFGAGNDDVFLFNVDSTGNLRWSKAIGGVFNEPGYGITFITFDNSFALCGQTFSFGPGIGFNSNATFIKTDTAGNGTCHTIAPNVLVSNPVITEGAPALQTGTGGNQLPTNTQVVSGLSVLDPCAPTGMENILTENFVTVYPNPFQYEATVSIFNLLKSESKFFLYDVLGREVIYFKMENSSEKIQRGKLESGIYFYKVINGDGIVGDGKLVIND